jgi:hypothetical protein
MMSNVYTAKAKDGSSYEVSTSKHHSDHDEETFKKHLTDVIKGTISGVGAIVIVEYIFKGRK